MVVDVDLLVCEEIKQKYGPWCRQLRQIPHQVEVEDHDVGQSSHLRSEWNAVQGLFVDLTTKDFHNGS